MDFTDNKFLVNQVKSAVDQPRLRKVLDRKRMAEYIPALSPLIMTSNPPPPLNDAAFMKRVVTRYFPDKEVHPKDEQSAKDFDILLSQLGRLAALGRFRNRLIITNERNSQQLILDKKLTPLEKSRKILIAAYESADMLMPCWLSRRQLEQNQLRESIVDAKEAVLVAFESLIIDKMKGLRGIDPLKEYTETSSRLDHLAANNLLPFIKKLRDNFTKKPTNNFAIHSGIVKELYKYGVTKEQLANLKAFADYLGGKYHKSHGYMAVEVSLGQLETYFGEKTDDSEPRQTEFMNRGNGGTGESLYT